MENENNQVTIVGHVEEIQYSHTTKGENFYRVWVSTSRLSGIVDTLPVVISELLLELHQVEPVFNIHIDGQYRSFNLESKLDLFIFATNIYITDELPSNAITLTGYLCKPPIYRKTPLNREIADMLIAVNRNQYRKSDYLPCVCWSRNAQYVSVLPVGTCISLSGRVQSREYRKKISEGVYETRIAYEVSASNVTRVY